MAAPRSAENSVSGLKSKFITRLSKVKNESEGCKGTFDKYSAEEKFCLSLARLIEGDGVCAAVGLVKDQNKVVVAWNEHSSYVDAFLCVEVVRPAHLSLGVAYKQNSLYCDVRYCYNGPIPGSLLCENERLLIKNQSAAGSSHWLSWTICEMVQYHLRLLQGKTTLSTEDFYFTRDCLKLKLLGMLPRRLEGRAEIVYDAVDVLANKFFRNRKLGENALVGDVIEWAKREFSVFLKDRKESTAAKAKIESDDRKIFNRMSKTIGRHFCDLDRIVELFTDLKLFNHIFEVTNVEIRYMNEVNNHVAQTTILGDVAVLAGAKYNLKSLFPAVHAEIRLLMWSIEARVVLSVLRASKNFCLHCLTVLQSEHCRRYLEAPPRLAETHTFPWVFPLCSKATQHIFLQMLLGDELTNDYSSLIFSPEIDEPVALADLIDFFTNGPVNEPALRTRATQHDESDIVAVLSGIHYHAIKPVFVVLMVINKFIDEGFIADDPVLNVVPISRRRLAVPSKSGRVMDLTTVCAYYGWSPAQVDIVERVMSVDHCTELGVTHWFSTDGVVWHQADTDSIPDNHVKDLCRNVGLNGDVLVITAHGTVNGVKTTVEMKYRKEQFPQHGSCTKKDAGGRIQSEPFSNVGIFLASLLNPLVS